jgi:hypothetical protein
MIVAQPKPMEEIARSISSFRKVLVLGCGTCVTVCLTGGDKEAHTLARDLAGDQYFKGKPPVFEIETIERQCDWDFLKNYLEIPEGCEAILSLACGAGVQTLANMFKELPVIPAQNTTFLGALVEPGVWKEHCGGSSNGKCEINREVDCAWQLIVDRLTSLGRLEDYEKIHPPKDWSAGRSGGPRSMARSVNTPY